MDKLRGTIITVLGVLGRPVYRTEIVKFVYMIDEIHFRHFGTTITGVDYKWDNFGPNSVGDAIVNEADELVNLGIIHMSPQPNSHGGTSYIYKLEKSDEKFVGSLSQGEQYVIKDITCRYRELPLDDLIKESKQTESFQGVKQFEAIKLKKSREYEDIIISLTADKNFINGVEAVKKELVG